MQDTTDGKKPKELSGLWLCGNSLPWVNKHKHLGNTILNIMDGNQLDVKVKTAKYIDKNNSLSQEFYFVHPQTKVKLNNIYNSHFTGSPLWKFGTRELAKLESTYNRSIKIMYDLPWGTHRFFIEPLSGVPHVSRILVRRYLSFIDKIRNSSKVALNQLLETVQKDVRLTTGFNLRFIMMLAEVNRIEDLKVGKVDFDYHTVEKADKWKMDILKELINVRHDDLTVPGLGQKEVEEIIEYICTS